MSTPKPPEPPDFIETLTRAGISLIPGIGGALQVIYEDVRSHIAARQWQTMREIAKTVGEGLLRERLKGDPERQALFANGVEVATRTGLEAKRRLLSKVVSAAMLDDKKVDGAQLRVEALRDLDVPQIRALERLYRLAQQYGVDHNDDPGHDLFVGTVRRGLAFPPETSSESEDAYHVAVQEAWHAEPHPVRAALTRTGVAFAPSQRDTYGFAVDGITEFGHSLIVELHEVESVDWDGTRKETSD